MLLVYICVLAPFDSSSSSNRKLIHTLQSSLSIAEPILFTLSLPCSHSLQGRCWVHTVSRGWECLSKAPKHTYRHSGRRCSQNWNKTKQLYWDEKNKRRKRKGLSASHFTRHTWFCLQNRWYFLLTLKWRQKNTVVLKNGDVYECSWLCSDHHYLRHFVAALPSIW